jgi:DNA-binding transcriptional LysR family regulator
MPLAQSSFTLDQLRVMLAVEEAGSLSLAAKQLGRAQSAISFVIASLERTLDLKLFDRSARGLTATPAGVAILAHAREIVGKSKVLARVAADLAAGQEAEVLLAVDVLYPQQRIVELLARFTATFPTVPVRLFVEPLGGVAELVRDRMCGIGVIASLPDVPAGLIATTLGYLEVVAVAAPSHPLAHLDAWPDDILREHLQIVVTDRTILSQGRDFAVFGSLTWRTSDIGAKREMILAGLGWGALPLHFVEQDLRAGRLVRLSPSAWRNAPLQVPVRRIRHVTAAMGPATAHIAALLDEVSHYGADTDTGSADQ